ncbi:MAG: WbqC family protein [bacterium]
MRKSPNRILLPVAYLPPIAWFHYFLTFDEVWIEQYESYPKQTYRNRCEIYAEKGRMPLSIPVTKVNGNRTLTRDVQINNAEPWARNHWRAIETAYRKSPYFIYFKDDFQSRIQQDHTHLLPFNRSLIQLVCDILEISKPVNLTEEFVHQPEDAADLRDMSPKSDVLGGKFTRYIQVFDGRHGFIPNLSILDLIFNLGPDAKSYLEALNLPVPNIP